MDSLSQLALGAAVGVAVMGRRTAVWKAALWGGIAGTLPDLDAFIDHGDDLRNMVLHRADSHGLFWLTLGAPALAWVADRLSGRGQFRVWWLAMWLALVTHPLLDTMTVYGTQLARPFSSWPYGVGSIFIIDPLYTLPLLVGVGLALGRRRHAGLGANRWGLALSTAYLAWGAVAQAGVTQRVEAQLAAEGQPSARVLVTPAPLQTLLWRVVVMREDGYEEGFRSLLDGERPIHFDRFASDRSLEQQLRATPIPLLPPPGDGAAFMPPGQRIGPDPVQRLAAFSHGFYKVHAEGREAFVTDLRMGQEPGYVFSFRIARQDDQGRWLAVSPANQGYRGDTRAGLAWLWQRMWGRELPPPR